MISYAALLAKNYTNRESGLTMFAGEVGPLITRIDTNEGVEMELEGIIFGICGRRVD